ncbi:MAG: energy transducer TonB [Wenzhouxiangellaceae bacterium]
MRTRRIAGDDRDALLLGLVLAVAIHAVVISQVGFRWLLPGHSDEAPSLDVILVDTASDTAPDQADFLAQANQRGGGENDETERPTAPPAPDPVPQPDPGPELLHTAPPPEADPSADEVITVASDAASDHSLATETAPETRPELPDRLDLLRQAQALTQMSPDPMDFERVLPKRPRKKFITANTREHLYAAYMRAWVAKVERIGNMNYPEEARRRNLEGSLVLSVDVLPDGSIERVQILRSSGHELLDEAAVRIVRLAAPFAPLPPDILKETDILTITRTWQFSARHGLN